MENPFPEKFKSVDTISSYVEHPVPVYDSQKENEVEKIDPSNENTYIPF